MIRVYLTMKFWMDKIKTEREREATLTTVQTGATGDQTRSIVNTCVEIWSKKTHASSSHYIFFAVNACGWQLLYNFLIIHVVFRIKSRQYSNYNKVTSNRSSKNYLLYINKYRYHELIKTILGEKDDWQRKRKTGDTITDFHKKGGKNNQNSHEAFSEPTISSAFSKNGPGWFVKSLCLKPHKLLMMREHAVE